MKRVVVHLQQIGAIMMGQYKESTSQSSTPRQYSVMSESGMGHHPSSSKHHGKSDLNRILLVSNEQQVRICLSQILVKEGYKVDTTTNGTDAIFLYHQEVYPLVISDIALADMTGIELLKAVKSMDVDAQVIVTSNYASLDSVLQALRAGAYDYLVKPSESPFQVIAAVKRALGRIGLIRENERLLQQLKLKTQALEQANTMLQNYAINDGLTGLYNRRHFQDCLSSEIDLCERYADCFALLFMDLDHFKTYNDINGHLEGDALLQSLASLFSRAFRKTDTVARYGGDEFAVILHRTTMAQALQIGEKVCQQVAEHPFKGLACLPEKKITISVGCAVYPYDGTTNDELLRLADQALYRVKNNGRGQVS